jgi:3-oxoacyl-[acyl-carrier protein] reductase
MSARSLVDRTAVVTGTDNRVGAACAAALGRAGADVTLIGPTWADPPLDLLCQPALVPVADTADPDAWSAAMASAAGRHRRLDLLVHAHVELASLVPRPLVEVDAEMWRRTAEVPIVVAANVCAGALRAMGPGGQVFVVVPSVSQFGAPGFVPHTAALEAVRIMAKSAARRWGALGVTVNCLAPPLESLVPAGIAFDSTARSLSGRSLAAEADPPERVGEVVVSLAAGAAQHVTGATLCIDDGVWMT